VSTTDRYAEWDAAYVLGGLSPAERNEFEQHLAGCERCRTAVGELAGMPGLLAQVPPAEAWAMAEELPSTKPHPRPARTLLAPRWWQLAVAAVLLAVLGGLGGFAVHASLDPAPASRLGFTPVGSEAAAMTGVVDLVPVAGGTDVRVECQYAEPVAGETYSIWVEDRKGQPTEIKDWQVRPNRVMHPSGHSPLPLRSIRAVEIRSGLAGPAVLRVEV
jgi:anti-sigma factor RsiW